MRHARASAVVIQLRREHVRHEHIRYEHVWREHIRNELHHQFRRKLIWHQHEHRHRHRYRCQYRLVLLLQSIRCH